MAPLKQPRDITDLALRQADQARTDFAAIAAKTMIKSSRRYDRRHCLAGQFG